MVLGIHTLGKLHVVEIKLYIYIYKSTNHRYEMRNLNTRDEAHSQNSHRTGILMIE